MTTPRQAGEPPATAGGRKIAGGEVNRNERAARWAVATIEVAGEPPATAGGRKIAGGEVNQNERAARWAVATIEIADGIVTEILDAGSAKV